LDKRKEKEKNTKREEKKTKIKWDANIHWAQFFFLDISLFY